MLEKLFMKLDELKGKYFAFVLSDESRAQLLRTFSPHFSKVICHHVTIEFNPEKHPEFIQEMIDKAPEVFVTGLAIGDDIECLSARIGDQTERRDGSFYHITLSLEPPAKPVKSNTLKDKIRLIKGIYPVQGSFKLVSK
jgi:hypothetical protein